MRSSSLRTPYGTIVVELAREVERMPVRQVAAVRQVHPEDRVARLQQREVDRHVGLRARVRLDVGVLGAEERLRAVDGERSRRRRRTRSRRSSACPGYPSAYLFVRTEPAASSTAWLTKFSEAMSSRPVFWRLTSLAIAAAISGSVSASERQRDGASVGMSSFGFSGSRFRRSITARIRVWLSRRVRSRRSGRSGAGDGRLRRPSPATAARFRRRARAATMRPPIARTLASLCCRDSRAV